LTLDHRPDLRLAAASPPPTHGESIAAWRTRRSFRVEQFPLELLLEAKQSRVAVILPAREVAGTIAGIVQAVLRLCDVGLVDEALVVDASSHDGTAELAAAAGIRVVQQDELAREYGPTQGKGDAMWRGLAGVSSELVAFLDTDTTDFHEGFVRGLVGPLICEPRIEFVKGRFERPRREGATLHAGEGGRVTELMARPLLNLFAPELAVFDQPLAGEVAARRGLLEQLPFCVGYGVEIAMLIDAWRLVGLEGLAQVDLGERQNDHQPLRELSAMAYAVLAAASSRLLGDESGSRWAPGSIALPPSASGEEMELRDVPLLERPPLARPNRARAL
jgi:hypothetical protein